MQIIMNIAFDTKLENSFMQFIKTVNIAFDTKLENSFMQFIINIAFDTKLENSLDLFDFVLITFIYFIFI